MGRRGRPRYCLGDPCVSCANGAILYYPNSADDEVSWRELAVVEGAVTVIEKTAPCITFYVDSVNGDWDSASGYYKPPTETGNGTSDSPWRDLNSALRYPCGSGDAVSPHRYGEIAAICRLAAQSAGCPKVKLRVKGTVGYNFGTSSWSTGFGKNLIIESWDSAPTFSFSVDHPTSGIVPWAFVNELVGVIFKGPFTFNARVGQGYYEYERTYFSQCWCFTSCSDCIFDAVSVTSASVVTKASSSSVATGFGSVSSQFIDCEATVSSNSTDSQGPQIKGFAGYGSSIFHGCHAQLSAVPLAGGSPTNVLIAGYYGYADAIFDSCSANYTLASPSPYTTCTRACGWAACPGASFVGCSATPGRCEGWSPYCCGAQYWPGCNL